MISSLSHVDQASIWKGVRLGRIGQDLGQVETCCDHWLQSLGSERQWGCYGGLKVRQSILAFSLAVEGVVDEVYHMSYNGTVAHDRCGPGKSSRVRNVGVARHEWRNHLGMENLRRMKTLLNGLLNNHCEYQILARLDSRCAFLFRIVSYSGIPRRQKGLSYLSSRLVLRL
jgi:hypothetical protein